MKTILKTLVILLGLGTLAFLLIEPNFEGRNANASFYYIYFQDPFLLFAYLASIPCFIILYQVYKILNSKLNTRSLKIIKNCALINILSVLIGEIWIAQTISDDRAGGFFMGFLITLVSIGIIVVTGKFETKLATKKEV